MKGDFTRNTFRPEKHYSSVRMQQGRVQLDADWNEQLDIQSYLDRLTHLDVIGRCGGPMGLDENGDPLAGFEMKGAGADLMIGKGRYYVSGILVENGEAVALDEQEDLPDFFDGVSFAGQYLAYLDVWERHITALEDRAIREVALGGPDTTTRAKVVWQVRLLDPTEEAREKGELTCADFGPGWEPPASTGKLAARSEPDPDNDDPCIVPPEAGYRRLENQLYRVEIHKGGAVNTATFKWSRENGSIVTRWEAQDGNNLTVSTVGRDSVLRFSAGDWVELTDDTRELQGRRGVLVQLDDASGTTLEIDPTTIDDPDNPAATSVALADFPRNPKIRRWESEGDRTVSIPAANDGWLKLESGVEIKFEAGGVYKTGDYWTIPARTNLGDVLWPKDEVTCDPLFEYAEGIRHYYCKLAIVEFDDHGWHLVEDCRNLFPPLTEIEVESCCSASVGDGVNSTGRFDDIQEAVNSLDESGGTVCILPGIYHLKEPVKVTGSDITIEGCGRQAHIIGPPGEPALVLAEGENLRLDGLSVLADSDIGAIVLENVNEVEIVNCDVVNFAAEEENRMMKKAGYGSGKARIPSRYGETTGYLAGGKSPGGPAVFAMETRQLTLAGNLLYGLPGASLQTNGLWVLENVIFGGGVWVMDGSQGALVRENTIVNGLGAGVILGGIAKKAQVSSKAAGVDTIDVIGNRIYGMANSGISTMKDEDESSDLGEISDVGIAHNRIVGCAKGGLDPSFHDRAVGGIVLEDVAGLRVHDNLLSENGMRSEVPAVGLFLETCMGVQVSDNTILDNGLAKSDQMESYDFSSYSVNETLPNPYETETGHRFTVIEEGGAAPEIRIDDTGSATGMQCGYETEIAFAAPMAAVSLTLVTESSTQPKATAYDEAGNIIKEAQMTTVTGTTQTLVLDGGDIVLVRIELTDAETLLVQAVFTNKPRAFQGGIIALYALSGNFDPGAGMKGNPLAYPTGSPALQAHDNVVVAPVGQALMAIGLGAMSFTGNKFTSRGPWLQPLDLPEETEEEKQLIGLSSAQNGKCVSIMNLGQAMELFGLAALFRGMANSTYMQESFGSGTSLPFAASAALAGLVDGRVLFNDNQVTYEDLQKGTSLGFSALVALSYDEVSLQDNQIMTTSASAMFAATGVLAATVRVANNRFTEFPGRALISCMSIGILMNTMTGNQATHCLFGLALLPGHNVSAHNQELITVFCDFLRGLMPESSTKAEEEEPQG